MAWIGSAALHEVMRGAIRRTANHPARRAWRDDARAWCGAMASTSLHTAAQPARSPRLSRTSAVTG